MTSFSLKVPYPSLQHVRKPDPKTEFVELEEKKELKEILKVPKIPPPYVNIRNKIPTLKKIAKPKFNKQTNKTKKKSVSEDIKEGFTQDEIKEKSFQTSPEYLNYYDMIREKIRKNAFEFYHRRENGRVIIDFVLSNNGGLVDVSVKIEGSSNSRYLREIALKSVYQSLPFTKFPEELKAYKNLPFNVSIFFRTK